MDSFGGLEQQPDNIEALQKGNSDKAENDEARRCAHWRQCRDPTLIGLVFARWRLCMVMYMSIVFANFPGGVRSRCTVRCVLCALHPASDSFRVLNRKRNAKVLQLQCSLREASSWLMFATLSKQVTVHFCVAAAKRDQHIT
eukprot:TRINITY_DN7616_c0_g1_i3.p2 TRINITY_DN7616_c0_g1~~TRINITY_DN7616_c0_g1_i3.p2  ORF type:complete len:142 (+),score=2.81 TRINITY_DN7616_c0_g1_i3:218-643(+)